MVNKKETLIVGCGETACSVARYLSQKNISFAVADNSQTPKKHQSMARDYPNAPMYLGEFDADVFCRAEAIIVSPGVPTQSPALRAATARGIPMYGDIEIFARECPPDKIVLGVTGSNGKSTVCRLLADMAIAAGHTCALGGNYGKPALDLLDDSVDVYVLELSSFQLETTYSLSGHIAAILNIRADHLDRYTSLEGYAQAKHRILQSCRVSVLGRGVTDAPVDISFGLDEPQDKHFGIRCVDAKNYIASGDSLWLDTDEIRLVGRHGWLNIMAALAIGTAAGFQKEAMLNAVRKFSGLPHRISVVSHCRDAIWIDDSKATNVASTMAALESMEGACIWLGGGLGKGADFSPLRDVARQKVRLAILYGHDARLMAQALDSMVAVKVVKTLDEAVSIASRQVQSNETVLLSPACASWDQYRDYKERGEHFLHLLQQET